MVLGEAEFSTVDTIAMVSVGEEVSSAEVAVSAAKNSIEQALASSIPSLAQVPQPYRVLAADGHVDGYEPELTERQLRELYTWMVFRRQLEERGLPVQRQGRIGVWGPMIGQDAAQAGLGRAVR